jgi:hypothetical protein
METTDMSRSFRHEFGAYIRTRFPLWLALSLPLFLTVAAQTSSRPISLLNFFSAYGQGVLLVFIFRLWDDIADRPRDQHAHPERVLSQSSLIQEFVSLDLFLAILSVFLTIDRYFSAPTKTMLALYSVLFVWYWLRERLPWVPVLNYHIILTKYPCFVMILSGTSDRTFTPTLFSQAAVVYLLLCVFEVLHDRELRRFGVARVMAFVEFVLAMLLIFIVH